MLALGGPSSSSPSRTPNGTATSPSPSTSPPAIVLPTLRHPPRSPASSPKATTPRDWMRPGGAGRLHVTLPPRHPSSGPSLLQLTPKHRPHDLHPIHEASISVVDIPGGQSNGFESMDRSGWWGDLKLISALAIPNSLTFLVSSLVSFTSVIFIGRLGAKYMGAAALGGMIANLFGFSVGQGMTSALDALCSQAYGAKEYQLVGRHTQRAMVVLTGMCFPVAIIWTYSGRFLELAGIEQSICDLAGQYTYVLIIGMWPNFMFECLRRYLQSQGILWPVLASAISTAVISIGLNYLLIFVFDFGFAGPAIASALSNWVMFLTCVACIIGRTWYRKYRALASLSSTSSAISSRRRDGETYAALALASPRPPNDAIDVVCLSPPPPMSYPASPGPGGAFSGASSPIVEMATIKHRMQQHQQQQQQHQHHQFPSGNGHFVDPSSPDPALGSPDGTPFPSSVSALAAAPPLDPEDCWPSPWTLELFHHWGEFLKLALPGAASLFVEWGSYEVSASLSARLGATPLAVHSIFMQTAGLCYMVPLGIATAASICIGQFLGAARGDRARDIARLALVLNAIHPILVSFVLVVFLRSAWGRLFTSDPDVLASCSRHLPIMVLYVFFDHVKAATMAILRGCGRAPVTVYGNTLACWLVGFPLAYLLVFRLEYELWGVWTAMSMAWATVCLLYYVVIARTDWAGEVEDAKQRTARSLGAPSEQATEANDASYQPTDKEDDRDGPTTLQLQHMPSAIVPPAARPVGTADREASTEVSLSVSEGKSSSDEED